MSHGDGSTNHITSISHEVNTDDTVETVDTAPEAPAPAEAPSLTSVDSNAGITKAASQSATAFQVNITLDAETHDYFRTRAAADDRSLNKFLARELKRYVVAATTQGRN